MLVNCFSPEPGAARAVVPDEAQGGQSATDILIRGGHRRIAFINATTPAPAFPDQEGGYGATKELLKRDITAVYCYNDRMAMGLYDGLRENGLSIPDDIAVVGFDNQEVIAAHLRPPLSTVSLPHYELGAAGVRLLLGLDTAPADSALKIECPAVERASVAVPSKA